MRQSEATRIIARNDMRLKMRTRSFYIRAFVAPILLATIISFAFGGGEDFTATIGVVDADGSPVSAAVAHGLARADAGGLTFQTVRSARTARARMIDGNLGAAVVVPAGYGAALAGDRPRDLDVLTDDDAPVAGEVAKAVAREVTARAAAGRLAVATATATGARPPSEAELARIDLPITVSATGTGGDASPAAYFGPAMGLLFLLLSLGVVARDLQAEKRTGLLDRVRSGPVGPWAIIAGRGLSTVAASVLSLVVIWAFTSVVLGADWGDPAGVVAVILAASLAVAGIAGFVAAVARTEQSAETLALVAGFVSALLGGAFIPLGQLPPLLGALGLLTPLGQALRAFALLSAGDATLVDVLPWVAALLAWAVATGVVAARLLPVRLGSR
ncbi:MAG TPA: ABC transporter permease [Acidimicrobiales bacterium]|nr:ABC transporter permease [Acidimicrobiales bacterium]